MTMNTVTSSCQRTHTDRCQGTVYYLRRNGDNLVCSNQEDGYTMRSINQSHLYCCLEDLLAQIQPLVELQITIHLLSYIMPCWRTQMLSNNSPSSELLKKWKHELQPSTNSHKMTPERTYTKFISYYPKSFHLEIWLFRISPLQLKFCSAIAMQSLWVSEDLKP